ncbi:MAG: adenylate/guanylate cyclase domain-containing protein [Chloroflexi bacterium]|nr:adenylate/guanylate cyclase domain-containing protein [Chloroflexota bacterium]
MTASDQTATSAPQTWFDRHPTVRRIASWVSMTWTPDDEIEHRREMLMSVSLATAVAGLVWAAMYASFGETLAAIIPGSYGVITLITMVIYRFYPKYRLWRYLQFAMFNSLPFALMLALGGFVEGSAVVIWSMLTPFGALVWGSRREAFNWFIVFLGMLVVAAFLESTVRSQSELPIWVQTAFFVMNFGAVFAIGFTLLRHFVNQQRVTLALLDAEREKSESLLLNVLPEEVAGRLKVGTEVIADYYPSVSILFADVVGFTMMSSGGGPEKMVGVLNDIFSHFDELAVKYGVEKIRTIGDGYMAVCGAPVQRDDHARRLANMALEMLAYDMPEVDGQPCELRIGINSGDVIAGVVGTTKFHYDVWGDAVNIAARMESQGVPGKIQIGPGAYELLKDDFACPLRGEVEIKGKGLMQTWFLEAG